MDNLFCSPKKIRKLPGKNEGITSTPLSRATSTPTREIAKDISMSTILSSISNISISDHHQKTLRSKTKNDNSEIVEQSESPSVSHQSSLFTISPNDITDYSEMSSTILQRSAYIKFLRGKKWNYLKPKMKDTLYWNILNNLNITEEIAEEFANTFKIDEKKSTVTLIKFFVDICGYQLVNVEDYLSFDKDFNVSCKNLMKMFLNELTSEEMLVIGTYIFYEGEKVKSKLGCTLALAVENFLELVLIETYHLDILFHECFYKHIFSFIHYMCSCKARPVRYTGIVLVRLCLRVFNRLHLSNVASSNSMDSSNKKDRNILKYIQFFYKLFVANSFSNDDHLKIHKLMNVRELRYWMVSLPHIYLDKGLYLFKKLIIDESKEVRLGVLEVLGKLIISLNIDYLLRNIQKIIDMIFNRLTDIELKVTIKVIDLFSLLLENYHQFIRNDLAFQISRLLFSKSYLGGKAAAAFLLKLFKHRTDKDFLEYLVDITKTPELDRLKPLMVEAFSEFPSVLQNYNFLIQNLLISNEDPDDAIHLIKIIYYSVYQKLKGKTILERKNSVQAFPLNSDHEEISKAFSINFKRLLNAFKGQNNILNYLFKIMCLIESDILSASFDVQNLVICRNIFLSEDNDEILDNICNFFSHFCHEKDSNKKSTSMKYMFMINLFECASKQLQRFLEGHKEEVDINFHFQKIGKLYEKFNMNEYFHLNSLFSNWEMKFFCEGQIVACKQYLFWAIKEIVIIKLNEIEPDVLRMKTIRLEVTFKEMSGSLFDFILNEDEENSLRCLAFENLCNLHSICDEILLDEPQWKQFRYQILKNFRENYSGKLCIFFKNEILQKTILSLECRRKYISCWLNLILNCVLDARCFYPLFESYHMYSEDYGDLVEYSSEKLFNTNAQSFFNLILYTLIKITEDLENPEISFNNTAGEKIIALAEKFANLKQFSNNPKELYEMIHLAIISVSKNKNFEFLALLKCFTNKLSKEYHNKCLQFFDNQMFPEHKNQKYVQLFKTKLISEAQYIGKKMKLPRKAKRKLSGKENERSEQSKRRKIDKNTEKSKEVEELSSEEIENFSILKITDGSSVTSEKSELEKVSLPIID